MNMNAITTAKLLMIVTFARHAVGFSYAATAS